MINSLENIIDMGNDNVKIEQKEDSKTNFQRQIQPIDTDSKKKLFDKIHSPSIIFNSFSPTHFSPKYISPLKHNKSSTLNTMDSSLLKPMLINDEEKKEITPFHYNKLEENLLGFLLKSLQRHFFFGCIDSIILTDIINSFQKFEFKKNEIIIKEGKESEYLYIIYQGTVTSYKNEKLVVKSYHIGSLLLDDLFFSNKQSNYNFVCEDNTILFGCKKTEIVALILEETEKTYTENRMFLDQIIFFNALDEVTKNHIAYNMKTIKFPHGTLVIKQDSPSYNFYILKKGLLVALQDQNFSFYLHEGEGFGENVFFSNLRNFNIKVESVVVECLCIEGSKLEKILGDHLDITIYNSLLRKSISKSSLFKELTDLQTEKLIKLIKVSKMKKEETLKINFNSIVFIMYGKVLLTKNSNLFHLSEGAIINEENLKSNEIQNNEILIEEDSFIGEVQIDVLLKELGFKNFKKLIKENAKLIEKKLIQKVINNSIIQPKLKVDTKNILVLKIVGEGISGLVLLVEFENELYALKIISKGWIVENSLEEYIINEKEIYNFIDFPFITSLKFTFKDDLSVYFMMEFVNGVDLFDVFYEKIFFEEDQAKFYAATLILCLQYLHTKGIIHRDIKPENAIIDEKGYLKLCDLGIAKLMQSNSSRTYTVMGTKYYIAPEMVLGRGYSFPVDFWALGICIYQFLCGDLPFGANEEEPQAIYECIVKQKLKFPKEFDNPIAKDLIKKLLKKRPEVRLGKSFVELKKHPWFDNFDWEKLLQRQIVPKYIPTKEKCHFKTEEIIDLREKKVVLGKLLTNPEIEKLRVLTKMTVSEYENWDKRF